MRIQDLKPMDVIIKETDGKLYKVASNEILITKEELIRICKYKHYRTGSDGARNYSALQTTLRELGLNEAEVKECLHP